MTKKISVLRKSAFFLQSGLCYYCNLPIWEGNPEQFQQQYGLSTKQAMRFLCTAEHLVARQDGGNNARSNIVAACQYCNKSRHARLKPMEPNSYKLFVQKRLIKLRWHGVDIIGRFHRSLST